MQVSCVPLHKKVVAKPVESFTLTENNLELLSRSRHLHVWHDNSTIANHGYFLVTVNTCYNKNLHFTRDKHKAKTGIDIDIQTAIEQSEINILTKHLHLLITNHYTVLYD